MAGPKGGVPRCRIGAGEVSPIPSGGEYETIREAGAEVVAVSADSPESHQRFCPDPIGGGCPFPLVLDKDLEAARQSAAGGLGEDGHRSHRGGILLHQIPWFQAGVAPAQFMEIFRALGAI